MEAEKDTPYFKSARIEGYKSIVNCHVNFKPGLNIIIGKNGTGKTNLLETIKIVVNEEMQRIRDDYGPSKGEIRFGERQKDKFVLKVEWEAPKLLGLDSHTYFASEGFEEVSVKEFHCSEDNRLVIQEKSEFECSAIMLSHSRNGEIPFLDDFDAGWTVLHHRIGLTRKYQGRNSFSALQLIIRANLGRLPIIEVGRTNEVDQVIIETMQNFIDRVIDSIRSTTIITDIKIRNGNIFGGNMDGHLRIQGYSFLFQVNGNYQPFQNLSDGTKRLFLLISELAFWQKTSIMESGDRRKWDVNLFMLEEPELGIHPHQLQLLMSFIREQAKEKQIIITTHSPQVLDVLEKDELDRIILTTFDPRKGSQFRNLTEKEMSDARNFMSDMYLSDYWRFSDLEGEKVK